MSLEDMRSWIHVVVTVSRGREYCNKNSAMSTESLDHVFKILLIGDAGVGKSRFDSYPKNIN